MVEGKVQENESTVDMGHEGQIAVVSRAIEFRASAPADGQRVVVADGADQRSRLGPVRCPLAKRVQVGVCVRGVKTTGTVRSSRRQGHHQHRQQGTCARLHVCLNCTAPAPNEGGLAGRLADWTPGAGDD